MKFKFLPVLAFFCFNIFADSDLLNSDNVSLSLMGSLEGRSIILKVKDKDGKNIGVFKPSSGSTLCHGEYASYKLAQMVGLDIYPKTSLEYLNIKTQKKVVSLLKKTNFKDVSERKEENRKIILEELNRNIQTNTKLEGAFKPWYINFQFYKGLGTKIGVSSHKIYKYLHADQPQLQKNKVLKLEQCTQMLEPKGCTIGYVFADDLAKDFSSMLLIDAVMGNNDRFPGGNVHFKAVPGSEVIQKPGKLFFKSARLFSLDNGAVLKPADKTALNILKEFKVSRFVKTYVEKLYEIDKMDNATLRKELSLSPEEFEIFKQNLKDLLQYIDALKKQYKQKIWFE
ncbi:MAG: hypothetical protein WCQ47_01685 [bacterium]